jgi:hypothetical protein
MKNVPIKVTPIKVVGNDIELKLEYKGQVATHKAKCFYTKGIFGVELPDEVSLLLGMYPKELKAFVGEVKAMFDSK